MWRITIARLNGIALLFEVEADESASLRFGDDDRGKRPDSGTSFTASYRVGNGRAGNIGAETLVLSRLVEAIAVHNTRRDRPRPLSLSVGSALYDPERADTLEGILETAGRRLNEQRTSSDTP